MHVLYGAGTPVIILMRAPPYTTKHTRVITLICLCSSSSACRVAHTSSIIIILLCDIYYSPHFGQTQIIIIVLLRGQKYLNLYIQKLYVLKEPAQNQAAR